MNGTLRILSNRLYGLNFIFIQDEPGRPSRLYRLLYSDLDQTIYPVYREYLPDMMLEISKIGDFIEIFNEGETKEEYKDLLQKAKNLAKLELHKKIEHEVSTTDEISKYMKFWENTFSPLIDFKIMEEHKADFEFEDLRTTPEK